MKVMILSTLVILISSTSQAYDNKYIHPAINELVVRQSNLDSILKKNSSFPSGIKTVLLGEEVWQWFREGGKLEDASPRYLKHFHDPLKPWSQAGLDKLIDPLAPRESSLVWAQDSTNNEYSWGKARDHFYQALTTGSEDEYAQTFRALGQASGGRRFLGSRSCPKRCPSDR